MGRPEFESMVAAAPKERLVLFTPAATSPVAAGVSEEIWIYANPGTIVRVIGAHITAPQITGATSGDHFFIFAYQSPAIDLMTGRAGFGNTLGFFNGYFTDATVLKKPAEEAAQNNILNNLHFDALKPLVISYGNTTDKPQNGARTIRIVGIERQVG